jgi:TctA family transporter
MFGIVEIIRNLEQPALPRAPVGTKFRQLWPSKKDFQESWRAVLRGTSLGSILGIVFFILEAMVSELIFGRSLHTYEKGH